MLRNRSLLIAAGLTTCVAMLTNVQNSWAAPQRPNLVVFLVDDMGWQDTSVPLWTKKTPFNERYNTPNMEKLVASGMKFTQAYACAICSPTRVSLMTGLNATRHRVTNWTLNRQTNAPKNRRDRGELTWPNWNANGMSPVAGIERTVHAKALPAFLKEVGYRTIHVGKAHFGAVKTPAEDPKAIGFDVNIAGHGPGGPASYLGKMSFAKSKDRPGANIWDIPGLEAYHGKDIFLTEALTIEANKAVDQAVADDKPFFLYMSHYAVHVPFSADERFIEKYRKMGLHEKEAQYAGLVEGMDKSLGDILANIERHGLTENTVVLFMSDNGGLSAAGRGGARHTHNKPLSSGKGSIHEGGIRVPMIARWPGVTKAGSSCDDYLIIEDFFPTLLELAGVANPQQIGGKIDGRSFVPLLKGTEQINQERPLFWHYPNRWGPRGPGIASYSAIRKGDWKLIFYHLPSHKPRFELFNIREDIGETTNRVADQPGRATSLKSELGEFLRDVDAQLPIDNATGKAITIEGL